MHSHEQELRRYLDDELGAAEKAKVKKHLAGCSTCRTHLVELQAEWEALTTILQTWTLPAELAQLRHPLSLPAREAGPQIKPGFISWASGMMIVLLFVTAKAIFLLYSQLNWAADLASLMGLHGRFEPFMSSLWNVFQSRPFYLAYLGELGAGIGLILAIMLPIVFYMISIGATMILFFNWFSLTFSASRPNKIRP